MENGRDLGLAAAAQPIHEAGHAVAVRLFTGVWPRFTLWAVFPPTIPSQKSVAGHTSCRRCGRCAVWAVVFACTCWRPAWKLALTGPSFTTAIALMSWFVAAALTPFGLSSVGASDAAKFIAVSGMNPVWVALVVSVLAVAMAACARDMIAASAGELN